MRKKLNQQAADGGVLLNNLLFLQQRLLLPHQLLKQTGKNNNAQQDLKNIAASRAFNEASGSFGSDERLGWILKSEQIRAMAYLYF